MGKTTIRQPQERRCDFYIRRWKESEAWGATDNTGFMFTFEFQLRRVTRQTQPRFWSRNSLTSVGRRWEEGAERRRKRISESGSKWPTACAVGFLSSRRRHTRFDCAWSSDVCSSDLLAKMATTVDEISHGRLILGVGAGWNEPEYQAFGLPYDHRVDRFEEALQIIKPLLLDGHVDFKGRYYQAPNCEIVPRGPRSDGPPLMVGSEGGPRMLKLTAQYADLWNTGYIGKPETLADRRTKLEAACH